MLGLRGIAEAPESSSGSLDSCRATGSSTVSAVANWIVQSSGSSYSISSVSGTAGNVIPSVGISNAVAAVHATSAVDTVHTGIGSLLGFGALGELPLSALSSGTTSGFSYGYATVTAVTNYIVCSVGSIGASSSAFGILQATKGSIGSCVGTASVTGSSGTVLPTLANATGASTCSGTANSFVSAKGIISGTSEASYIQNQTVVKTEYVAYVKISSLGLLWGTDVGLKDGVWASPLLSSLPEPGESLSDDYGIASVDNLRISIADNTLNTSAASLVGELLSVDQLITYTYSDGTTSITNYNRTYTVKNFSFSPGIVTLNCVDIDTSEFSKLFPTKTYTVEDWPLISSDVVGSVVPDAAGTGVKLPCVLISPTLFRYAVALYPTTILNVYRDDRLIPATEYVVGSSAALVSGYTVTTITFSAEQKDFSGNYYVIEADCRSNSTNAASELLRVLTSVGVSTNASSFSAAITQATNLYMNVDIGYRTQRTASTIVNDLLLILRGSLYRGSNGYELIQDIDRPLLNSWDEPSGDYIEVSSYSGAEPPEFVEVEYKPNVANPDELIHVIKKSSGGYTGTKRYRVPYLSDHQAADRLLDYLAKRLTYGGTVTSNILSKTVSMSDRIRLASSAVWTGVKDFNVRKITRGVGRISVTGLEYNSSVYTYSPQTYPVGAVEGYVPDYSKTPPAAPTSVIADNSIAAATSDGTILATIRGSAIPPSVNWVKMYVQATNTLTNEIYQAITSDIGSGRYGATLANLRPGQPHTMVAWAENAFGVQGIVSAPGSFTSAGYTSLPVAPTGVVSLQGTGKVINVTWVASTSGSIVDHYDVYRSVNGGGYSKVASAQGSYADTNVLYGSTYTYLVRAVDRSGNQSANSAATSTTLEVNVDTPDIVDGGVTTPKIPDNNVTTAKRQHMNSISYNYTIDPGAILSNYLYLGEEKRPTAVVMSGNVYVAAWVVSYFDGYLYGSSFNTHVVPITSTGYVDWW